VNLVLKTLLWFSRQRGILSLAAAAAAAVVGAHFGCQIRGAGFFDG